MYELLLKQFAAIKTTLAYSMARNVSYDAELLIFPTARNSHLL